MASRAFLRCRPCFFFSACLLVLFIFVTGSVVFFLPPKADQIITKENAEKIHEGMSAAKVILLLGREPDSKNYEEGNLELCIWNRSTLDPSDDPDMMIQSLIIVEFDGEQKVTQSCYVIHAVDKSWFYKLLDKVGF